MDYANLSLSEVRTGLDAVARDARTTFGDLDVRQLNWRPDPTRWSVGQCFDHLLTVNRLLFQAADDALKPTSRRSIWQRLPVLPRMFGRMLVRSQSPEDKRRFTAPPKGQPATSNIAADVVRHFVNQQREAVVRLQMLDEQDAARAIMTSPFFNFLTYSVLDGWRVVVAHDRRHFEQARRVMQTAGFPSSSIDL